MDIPGFEKRDHLRFVQLTRPQTVGDRICSAGDVLAVMPPGVVPVVLLPPDPRLYYDRAQRMVEQKLAKAHPGPATVALGASLHKPVVESAGETVEQEVVVDPGRRTATAAPQRRGAGAI